MKLPIRSSFLAGFALVAALAGAQTSHSLTIGDPAPPLKPAQWLKGTPVANFDKGQVYVVEFWATWCGPCKESIPHLTELAHKIGSKASIIGVSIWETTDPDDTGYMKKVKDFVKSEGSQMDYTVAADSANGKIANSWMKSASESGIPTCFVVDGDGRIAWIGHPEQLEPVLDAVLAHQFDVQGARSRREIELDITRPVDEALSAKHYAEALKRIDVAVGKRPNLARFYVYYRLIADFHLDWANAKSVSDGIIKDANGDIGAYRMIDSILATQPGLDPNAYRYGLALVDDALKQGQMGYLFLAMKSDIYSNLGDKDGAAKAQGEAVAAAEKDSHAPADFVDQMKRKLEKLQVGAGKS